MNGPRLSIIPAGAVTDRSLEPRDLQVLCLLGRHLDKLGWCSRSQVKMAVEIACGRSSVQRSIERLVEAGWVEKKRRDALAETEEPGQPSASYAYRVRLDRDDFAFGTAVRDTSESHAEIASQDGDYPPVGTLQERPNGRQSVPENDDGGAQQDGHPGAQPYAGTGCPAIRGHHNDLSERSSIERERDTRARDRTARFVVNFEARWPTAAADDRQRTAYAAEELTELEQQAALAAIGPFLGYLKRHHRKNVPAGWKYLGEKRWTLIEVEKPTQTSALTPLAADGDAAKAVRITYEIVGQLSAVHGFMRSSDGGIWYRPIVTPQLLAMAKAAPAAEWVTLEYKQAGAWNNFLKEFVTLGIWTRLHEGSRAPWPWPPGIDGKIYAGTGPPENLMTTEDEKHLPQLGKMTG